MYIDTGTMIAILIALGTSMLVIMLSYNAHKKLFRKYDLLKINHNAMRKDCELHHAKIPF